MVVNINIKKVIILIKIQKAIFIIRWHTNKLNRKRKKRKRYVFLIEIRLNQRIVICQIFVRIITFKATQASKFIWFTFDMNASVFPIYCRQDSIKPIIMQRSITYQIKHLFLFNFFRESILWTSNTIPSLQLSLQQILLII